MYGEGLQEIDAGNHTHDEVQPVAPQAKIPGSPKHGGRLSNVWSRDDDL